MPKTRVALKFSVRCFEALPPMQLPDGRTFAGVPRHWRMFDEQERVIASGPYESEPIILALVKLSARYTQQFPRESRELVGSLAHIKRKLHVVGPDGNAVPEVGSKEWWDAKEKTGGDYVSGNLKLIN